MDRESLWKILRYYGIPEKLLKLIQIFYRNSCSVGKSTTKFTVKSGVRQGCVMSSFLSTLAIDWATKKNMINQQWTGIRWNLCSSLEDLIYVDDLVLPSHTRDQIQRKTSNLEQQASSIDLSSQCTKRQKY